MVTIIVAMVIMGYLKRGIEFRTNEVFKYCITYKNNLTEYSNF